MEVMKMCNRENKELLPPTRRVGIKMAKLKFVSTNEDAGCSLHYFCEEYLTYKLHYGSNSCGTMGWR